MDELKKVPVIEEYPDELKFTDEYGASMIVEHIDVKGEQWVRVLLDNDKQEVRDYLEEHDEGVHLPLDLFKVFCNKTYKRGVKNGINKSRKANY